MKGLSRGFRKGRRSLVIYLCAGDPSLEATVALVPRLQEAGADIVELGIPFSDPIADGPTLQAAASRAIARGTSASKVVEAVAAIRKQGCDVPLVLMTYLNPLLSPSLGDFCTRAGQAGADALLIPDLPLEEAVAVRRETSRAGLELALLAAPTTTGARLTQIGQASEGFLYFVSVTGVTGAQAALPPELHAQLEAARSAAKVPVVVGFGVSTPEQARSLAVHADGVVVGSAVVSLWHKSGGNPEPVIALVRSLAEAVHG